MALPFNFPQTPQAAAGVPIPQTGQPSPPGALGGIISMQPGPKPPATPQEAEQIKMTWEQALARPEVKAGLMQFAINVLQPVQPGQSRIGNIAGAVGAGGEAINRSTEQQTAEAQRQTDNLARQQDLDIGKGQLEVSQEGVKVAREGLQVSREGQDIQREGQVIERERIAAETGRQAADIESMEKRLRMTIAANKELAGLAADDALFAAALTSASDAVDPLLYDNPEALAAAQTQAAQNAIATALQLRNLKQTLRDPSLITDDMIQQTLAINPVGGAANLRYMGVPDARIKANMPKPAPDAATSVAGASGTGIPSTPVAAPSSGPGANAPGTPGVTSTTTPAPAAAPTSAFGGPINTPEVQAQLDAKEAEAEAARAAAKAADPLQFAIDQLSGTAAFTRSREQGQMELKNALPATLEAVPVEKFGFMYSSPLMRGILEDTFGKDKVDTRATALGVKVKGAP